MRLEKRLEIVERRERVWERVFREVFRERQWEKAVESYLRESCMRRVVSILPF